MNILRSAPVTHELHSHVSIHSFSQKAASRLVATNNIEALRVSKNEVENTYNPGNPKLDNLFAITTAHPLFPPTQHQLDVVTCGLPPTESPLAMQLLCALLVQICVLSLGISTLPSASRQSERRAPPMVDWPQDMPVPDGKTAVAVVEVDVAAAAGVEEEEVELGVGVGVTLAAVVLLLDDDDAALLEVVKVVLRVAASLL